MASSILKELHDVPAPDLIQLIGGFLIIAFDASICMMFVDQWRAEDKKKGL